MFEEQCSIYRNAKDRWGIGQMQVGEFLFSGRWKEPVMRLRSMVAEYGALEAKKHEEYGRTKEMLPGATLSGLFRRRKGDQLIQHTGYIALDIDLGDNMSVSDFENILFVLRHRPEICCYMRSCSGTGYFALVRLAYPDKHKQQFAALRRDYSALGITLDKACSDITRIRFASYDDEPYINERAIPYMGVDLGYQHIAVRGNYNSPQWQSRTGDTLSRVERLVSMLEHHGIDITASYDDWVHVGFSLASLGEVSGREFFHRVSRLNPGYNAQECDKKFATFKNPRSTIGTFIKMCSDYGVR